MKRSLLSILCLALAFSLSAQGQNELKALIAETPGRAATNMHGYEFHDIKDTPAPAGFTPFYITHYGRHGSRYQDNDTFAAAALRGFDKTADLLTSEGKALRKMTIDLVNEHAGMIGQLSPRGAAEHRQLAARMAARFPEVFAQADRKEVHSTSSTKQRAIISMANFNYGLKEAVPSIQETFVTGDKFMAGHAPSFRYDKMPYSALGKPSTIPDFSAFMAKVFTDPAKAAELIGNVEDFAKGVYSAGTLCEDLDYLGYDILGPYFTTDNLVYFFESGNNSIYMMWGNSIESGDSVRELIKPLVSDLLERADAAMQPGSKVAADLRFGHDTGALPILAFLGLDSKDGERFKVADATSRGWYSFSEIPMATNFQLIVYKNAAGEKIAKMLHNEREDYLPASSGLKPVSGPYYKWDELRNYMQTLLNSNTSGYPVEHFDAPGDVAVDVTCIKHGTIAIELSKEGKHFNIVADAVGNVSYGSLRDADLVLVTHEHGDHLDPKTINSIIKAGNDSRIIANQKSYDAILKDFPRLQGKSSVFVNGDSSVIGPDWLGECTITAVPAYNTTKANLQFHPKGNGNGYVININGFVIYVAGDTEPLDEMKSIGAVDVAFLPVNQPYTMTPKQCGQAAKMIQPKVLIPYHMSSTDFEAIKKEVKKAAPKVEVRMHEVLR